MKLVQWSILAAILTPTLGNAAPSYSLSQLSAPTGFSFIVASAINQNGQIAGTSAFIDVEPAHSPGYIVGARATIWLNGSAQVIDGGAGKYSHGNAINDLGQVAGVSYTQSPDFMQYNTQVPEGLESIPPGPTTYDAQATVWHNGTVTTLAGLSNQYGTANAINNQGQLVGWSFNDQNKQTATSWRNGNAIALTTTGSASEASDINNQGQAVGWQNIGDRANAVFWTSDNQLIELASLGGIGSQAFAINDAGWAVGWSTSADLQQHATLWADGEAIDLGILGGHASYAYGINNLGQVVGSYINSPQDGFAEFAILWENGNAINLNSLIGDSMGVTLISANGINDQGWIIAQGEDSHGHLGYYLLAPVPEPSTYALLLAGLGLIAGVSQRKSRAINA